MSVASVREMKKRDKEARIRAAAMELIRRHGFAATTTAAVAERAGIAAGTLFRYVKTKEELLDLVFAGEIAGVVEQRVRLAAASAATSCAAGARVRRAPRLLPGRPGDGARARRRGAPAARRRALAAGHRRLLAADRPRSSQPSRPPAGSPATSSRWALALDTFSLYLGGVLTVVNLMGRSSAARADARARAQIHFRGLRPTPTARRPPPAAPPSRSQRPRGANDDRLSRLARRYARCTPATTTSAPTTSAPTAATTTPGSTSSSGRSRCRFPTRPRASAPCASTICTTRSPVTPPTRAASSRSRPGRSASGCADHVAAWQLNLSGMVGGLLPRRAAPSPRSCAAAIRATSIAPPTTGRCWPAASPTCAASSASTPRRRRRAPPTSSGSRSRCSPAWRSALVFLVLVVPVAVVANVAALFRRR